jgi:hypothetical protein
MNSVTNDSIITDGVGILENGVLTCNGVIADDIQAINLNVRNNITAGQSIAIGRDIAVGNSIVSPNLYTTKLVSNTLECSKLKTENIHLYNNLQSYDDTNVGYIKTSSIIASRSLVSTNTVSSIVNLPLPIGVYMVSYSFTLGLSDVSLPILHSITHGLSTDNAILNVIQKKNYQNLVYNDNLSYVTFNESGFFHITDYNSFLYLLINHNTAVNTSSNILIENAKISALRIA